MKRRPLLVGVVSGAVSALAGCGYAPGGGDVRRTTRTGRSPFGPANTVLTATPGEYVLLALYAGGMIGDDETVVNVIDRDGDPRWSHEHEGRSRGMAGTVDGDRVHVLTEDHELETATPDSRRTSPPRGTPEGEPAWSATLESSTLGHELPDEEREAVPVAADAAGAYVALADGVAAVRDGSVAWVVGTEDGGPVTTLLGSDADLDGGVLAVTASRIVSLAADGDRRWAVEDVSSPRVTATGDRLFVRDGTDLVALDAETGTRAWATALDAPGPAPTITGGRVAAIDRGAIRVVDADSGEPLWRVSTAGTVDPPVVVDASRAYHVDGTDAVAVGANDDGGWRRSLDAEVSGTPVAGWLSAETVAFVFDTGAFVWLQRRQADRGLL